MFFPGVKPEQKKWRGEIRAIFFSLASRALIRPVAA